jgi:hypothetical protein
MDEMPTSDSDNLEAIIGYLDLPQASEEVQRITGLTESAIVDVLRGQAIEDTAQRRHVEVVAQVLRLLADARLSATRSAERGKPAAGWLHSGLVTTGRGSKTPIEVLADADLAAAALVALRR